MKMNNATRMLGLLLLVFTLFATGAAAQGLQQALLDTNDFFTEERFRPYAAAIDFIIFTMLFIAIYMIGVKYAFQRNRQGKMEPPEKWLAIVLGFTTAFLLVIGGYSIAGLLPFLPYILLVILFLFLFYLLKNSGMNKLLAFLLALILALILAYLIMQLVNPDADFLGSFEPLDLPSIGSPSIGTPSFGDLSLGETPDPGIQPPDSPDGSGPPGDGTDDGDGDSDSGAGPGGDDGEAPGPDEGDGAIGWLEDNASWWWALPLILLLAFLGRKRIRSVFRRRQEGEEEPEQEEKTLEQVKEEIQRSIDLKKKIWKRMRELIKRKRGLSRHFLDMYHKTISHPNFDPAYYLDKDSPQYKEVASENKDVHDLISSEVRLMREMQELHQLEKVLMDRKFRKEDEKILKMIKRGFKKGLKKEGSLLEQWQDTLFHRYVGKTDDPLLTKRNTGMGGGNVHQDIDIAMKTLPEQYRRAIGAMSGTFKALYDGKGGIVPDVRAAILEYYQMTYKEVERDRKREGLTDAKTITKMFESGEHQTWFNLSKKSAEELQDYFKREAETLGYEGSENLKSSISHRIYQQVQYLTYILKLIEFLESDRKSFTQMQELWIEMVAGKDGRTGTWEMVGERGGPVTIQRGVHMRVRTQMAEGIPPFRIRCYVNKRLIKEKNIQKKNQPIAFNSIEIGQLLEGTHEIAIEAISDQGTYERRDVKSIQVTVYKSPLHESLDEHNRYEKLPYHTLLLEDLRRKIGVAKRTLTVDEQGNVHVGMYTSTIGKEILTTPKPDIRGLLSYQPRGKHPVEDPNSIVYVTAKGTAEEIKRLLEQAERIISHAIDEDGKIRREMMETRPEEVAEKRPNWLKRTAKNFANVAKKLNPLKGLFKRSKEAEEMEAELEAFGKFMEGLKEADRNGEAPRLPGEKNDDEPLLLTEEIVEPTLDEALDYLIRKEMELSAIGKDSRRLESTIEEVRQAADRVEELMESARSRNQWTAGEDFERRYQAAMKEAKKAMERAAQEFEREREQTTDEEAASRLFHGIKILGEAKGALDESIRGGSLTSPKTRRQVEGHFGRLLRAMNQEDTPEERGPYFTAAQERLKKFASVIDQAQGTERAKRLNEIITERKQADEEALKVIDADYTELEREVTPYLENGQYPQLEHQLKKTQKAVTDAKKKPLHTRISYAESKMEALRGILRRLPPPGGSEGYQEPEGEPEGESPFELIEDAQWGMRSAQSHPSGLYEVGDQATFTAIKSEIDAALRKITEAVRASNQTSQEIARIEEKRPRNLPAKMEGRALVKTSRALQTVQHALGNVRQVARPSERMRRLEEAIAARLTFISAYIQSLQNGQVIEVEEFLDIFHSKTRQPRPRDSTPSKSRYIDGTGTTTPGRNGGGYQYAAPGGKVVKRKGGFGTARGMKTGQNKRQSAPVREGKRFKQRSKNKR